MKVGLFINTQFPQGFNLVERIPEMVAQVRSARDAGFASLWFPHHWLTHPMQMLQLMPVMGYLAAHAEGMTIGPRLPDGRRSLVLVSDNNFAASQFTQFLLFALD